MKKNYNLFTILLGIAWGQAQFVEGFEGATLPAGWTEINQGDPNGWEIFANYTSSSNPHTGNGMLGIEYGSVAHDDYIITPPITVTAGVSDKLVLWGWNHGLGFLEQFDIKVSTTTPTASAFTTNIATNVKPPSRIWTQYSYDLSAYVGQTIYIALYIHTTDLYFLGIDDLQITGNLLSVNEGTSKSNVSVYPNPFADVITISGVSSEISDVKIYDQVGRLVLQPKLSKGKKEQTLDLTKLNSGVYMLSYIQNGLQQNHKIIKK